MVNSNIKWTQNTLYFLFNIAVCVLRLILLIFSKINHGAGSFLHTYSFYNITRRFLLLLRHIFHIFYASRNIQPQQLSPSSKIIISHNLNFSSNPSKYFYLLFCRQIKCPKLFPFFNTSLCGIKVAIWFIQQVVYCGLFHDRTSHNRLFYRG